MRILKVILLLSPLLFSASCSQKALSFFFDIPPPREEKPARTVRKEARPPVEAKAPQPPPKGEEQRPPIEKLLVWEEVEKRLPKDQVGQVNWMEALKQGIIKPRGAIDGDASPPAATFKFDFFLPGPAPPFDAFFPHSSHTQWLSCESCHPGIFPKRGMEITMDEIFSGELCGRCHGPGKVAFAAATACNRCHVNMN
ncbi:MAG: c(7)-type cytochrome triheme domain-containing protein [Nitrospinota bacterium]